MSARKLHGSWWVDFHYERKRHRIRSPENSKVGATAYESILRQRLVRGEPLMSKNQPTIPTLKEFARQWFETYVVTNNKPSEQRNKRIHLARHLLPFFGKLRLDEITRAHIEQYKTHKIGEGLAPKSVNNHLGILSKCLRCAVEWEVIDKTPRMGTLRVPPPPFDFLSPRESQMLLEAATDYPWGTMLLTALRTGMRLGELLALDWNDIDLERRIIAVRHSRVDGITGSPKNNKVRYVPISSELLTAFYAIPTRTGYVFVASHGKAVTKNIAAWHLNKYCKQSNLRHIGWHTLRHTFASQLASSGVPLRMVQEFLGHSTLQMTVRYAHLAPSSLADTIDILDMLPNRQPETFWALSGQQGQKNLVLPSGTSDNHSRYADI
ncbi:MAG: site-specific integrase [bacterium]|nr:site-specific integrase [bacterium]